MSLVSGGGLFRPIVDTLAESLEIHWASVPYCRWNSAIDSPA
jgi:hypothetical protein